MFNIAQEVWFMGKCLCDLRRMRLRLSLWKCQEDVDEPLLSVIGLLPWMSSDEPWLALMKRLDEPSLL